MINVIIFILLSVLFLIWLLLSVLFLIWLLGLTWIFTPFRPCKWFFHDILSWHEPDSRKGIEIRGINIHAKCKYCGKDIIRDSQGNWF